MKLDWMRSHRDLVEKIIKYGNAYANTYRLQRDYNTGVYFSASQIQTLEYILENEELDETMTQMAKRLGVTTSAFSKNVNKLVEKELLEKYRYSDNQKNIYLKVTEKGRETYLKYLDFIIPEMFSEMFSYADKMTQEDREYMGKILDIFAETLIWYGQKKPKPRKLVKLEPVNKD